MAILGAYTSQIHINHSYAIFTYTLIHGSIVACMHHNLTKFGPMYVPATHTYTGMWIRVHTQVYGYRYAHTHRYADIGTHTGMWIQVRTQVCGYRYTHRYVDTGTQTGMWIQVHTQVCGYRYTHRYVDTGTNTGMWIQVHTQVCGYSPVVSCRVEEHVHFSC